MLVLGGRIKALFEQKSYPIKNDRNHLVSPLVPNTKLRWFTPTVPLIFRTVPLKLSEHLIHQEGLLKHRFLGTTSRVSSSGSQGWGLRICISNKLLDDFAAASVNHVLRMRAYIKPSVEMATVANFGHLRCARHLAKQFTSIISFHLYKHIIGYHFSPLNVELWAPTSQKTWPKP